MSIPGFYGGWRVVPLRATKSARSKAIIIVQHGSNHGDLTTSFEELLHADSIIRTKMFTRRKLQSRSLHLAYSAFFVQFSGYLLAFPPKSFCIHRNDKIQCHTTVVRLLFSISQLSILPGCTIYCDYPHRSFILEGASLTSINQAYSAASATFFGEVSRYAQ